MPNVPIHIQTQLGAEFLEETQKRYLDATKTHTIFEFKKTIYAKRMSLDREIYKYLHENEDNFSTLDNPSWIQYKQMCDKYAVLKYFEER